MRAEVVTVTKDEYDLIEDWIRFHGMLFGFENVLVLDNGSCHPKVLEAYTKFAALGVRIELRHGPFDRKADWWTQACKDSDADLVFPLDTDEFLVVPSAAECSHQAVRDLVEGLLTHDDVSHFVIEHYMFAHVSGSEPWYAERQQAPRPATDIVHFRSTTACDKCFFRPGAIKRVGMGNHFDGCLVRWGNCAVVRDLALLHFHHTGERRRVERSWKLAFARKIVDRGDSEETAIEKLRAYSGTFSRHVVAHLVSHLETKMALGASVSDPVLFDLRDARTYGPEKNLGFEVVEWRYASSLLGQY